MLEIISILATLGGGILGFVRWKKYPFYVRSKAYQKVAQFGDEWELARTRNRHLSLAELQKHGFDAMHRHAAEFRTMRVLFSRSSTREIQRLGDLCRIESRRILKNQTQVENWPATTGVIGNQLRATLLTLKPA